MTWILASDWSILLMWLMIGLDRPRDLDNVENDQVTGILASDWAAFCMCSPLCCRARASLQSSGCCSNTGHCRLGPSLAAGAALWEDMSVGGTLGYFCIFMHFLKIRYRIQDLKSIKLRSI